MKKHAYLIMAHENYQFLNLLLNSLDDKRNDIYLHVDKKSKDFSANLIDDLKYADITIIDRISVNWGGYSQVKCELNLLREAIKKKHEYYHLISGSDFPLKSQNHIHNFFEINFGTEFIAFSNDFNEARTKFWYPFNEKGRDLSWNNLVQHIISHFVVRFQKVIKYKPRYSYHNFYKGANWFSITHEFAEYVVSEEKKIEKNFSHVNIPDEIFLQTVYKNSSWHNKIYKQSEGDEFEMIMRHIDWNRGNPYSFKVNDLNELQKSNRLFVRKMDLNEDILLAQKLSENFIKDNDSEFLD